jgi:hypothetical protein
MLRKHNSRGRVACFMMLLVLLLSATWTMAQPKPSRSPSNVPALGANPSVSESSVRDLRPELLKLLRLTPALAGAVAHDPSLLSDQQYVARTNPALAQFLADHPEVARNPEFFVFADLPGDDRVRGLQKKVWPEMVKEYHRSPWNEAGPVLAILAVVAAVLWLIRLFVDTFRWKRSLKVQAEMQSKMLDKFGSNQDLIAYLETEAGKRLLQVPAIPSGVESTPRAGGMLGRMLLPLQFGTVLIPIGIGLGLLRRSFPNEAGLVVLSTLVLTLGIGLSVAALVSWLMARHYGLLPQPSATRVDAGPQEPR